jgi:hypothetical protein
MFRKRADRIKGVAGSLDARRILITDAVGGAGPGIVQVTARAGAEILASSADTAMLDVVIAGIDTPPLPIVALPAPAAVHESLPARIDDLVINVPPGNDIESMTVWLGLIEAATVDMQDRGHAGNVVIVSSIERSGRTGSISSFMQHELEDLATRLAPNGIRANAVRCGPIGSTRRGQPRATQATRLGHVTVHPVDVGKAVWFLLNNEMSAAITGATIRVDRGASLTRPEW